MIIVRLLGGLGNQMFQYAFGKRLAMEHDVDLKVDTRLLLDHSEGRHAVNRSYNLDLFRATVRFAEWYEALPYSAWGWPRVARGMLRRVGVTDETRQWKEKQFSFDPSALRCGSNTYLSGLWQSYRYFEPIEAQLRQEFQLRQDLVGPNTDLITEIRTTNSVCVNIRRGDFVTNPQTENLLGFVGLEYYRRAMEFIRNSYNIDHVFVFSDDPNWCNEHLEILPDMRVIGHEHAGTRFANYLLLMQSCRFFLIPNSTFAWWAAWLSTREEKIVIRPRRWFRDETVDTSGLSPAGWLSM